MHGSCRRLLSTKVLPIRSERMDEVSPAATEDPTELMEEFAKATTAGNRLLSDATSGR